MKRLRGRLPDQSDRGQRVGPAAFASALGAKPVRAFLRLRGVHRRPAQSPDRPTQLRGNADRARNQSTDPGDDDRALADRLAERFPTVVRVPEFANASAAKSVISGLDFLVAGRMHACIAAFSAGVPVVPTAYSRKFSGLFGSLGYEHVMPQQGLSAEQAVAFVLARLENRRALTDQLEQGMHQVKGLLEGYRGQLRALFASLVIPTS